MSQENMIPQDRLEDFLDEIMDALINVDTALTRWHQNPRDSNQLSYIYTLFHKVKYNCNIIEARKLQSIAAATEELLEQVELHLYSIKEFPFDSLRKSADAFTNIVRNLLRDRLEGDRDYKSLVDRLKRDTQAIKEAHA